MEEYIKHKFIKPDAIEAREYQVSLANQAKSENCLVVLPTGLGKTAVALQVIADFLSKGAGGILFLAPTRVLANPSSIAFIHKRNLFFGAHNSAW